MKLKALILILLISTGWGSAALFNPASRDIAWDPKIMDAHSATLSAAKALDFGKGFNGSQDLINKIQAYINAIKEEAKLRGLTPSEVAKARELTDLRKDVIDGLTYAKKNANGDLDAKIYADGTSFNEKWSVSKPFVDKSKPWFDETKS